MEQFKISWGNQENADIISCYDKDLFMVVRPDKSKMTLGSLAFNARLNDDHDLYFVVLYPHLDPKYSKWSLDLFFNAVKFYYQEKYGNDPEYIQSVNEHAIYPYEIGPENLLLDDEPEKSEPITHISNEQYINFFKGIAF